MVFIQAEQYRFYYPGEDRPAVSIQELTIEKGSFCLLAGSSGSGKTTLLRQLSNMTILQGREEGRLTSHAILPACVRQDPASQIVTDRAEYEIVFGLENIAMPRSQMQRRLAEVVTFFGLDGLLDRDTMSLSGGEMQVLNVAAALALNPDLLLLDEPASQLDPVASGKLYDLLHRINDELGITVVVAEQCLEEAMPLCDQMILMGDGEICARGRPEDVFCQVPEDMAVFFPSYMQLYRECAFHGKAPFTKKAARIWFCGNFRPRRPEGEGNKNEDVPGHGSGEGVGDGPGGAAGFLCGRNLFFRYERSAPDVLADCSFAFGRGRITCLAGGNGSGKTTLLELIHGRLRPYHGKIGNPCGQTAYLPQQPGYLFLKDTVGECCQDNGQRMTELASYFGLDRLMECHPADLSGGELQRLGLCHVLGREADLYLLDEPAKGLDAANKELFGRLVREMALCGKTIVFVSHDMELAACHADSVALMFQGRVQIVSDARRFFVENQFYTTAINRIARDVSPMIITRKDVERYAEKKNH